MSPRFPWFSLAAAILFPSIVASRAQDVSDVTVLRTADYEQLADAEPLPFADEPFYVLAVMTMTDGFLSDPDNLLFVRGVTLQPPTGALRGMNFDEQFGGFVFYAPFDSASALENAFRAGNYRFTYGSFISGDTRYDLNVPDASLPGPARVVNFTAAQHINPAQNFTLQWTPPGPAFGGARVKILEVPGGSEVFDSGSLVGEHTSVAIPAGTLVEGQEYFAQVSLMRIDLLDRSGFPGFSAVSSAYTYLPLTLGTGAGEPEPSRFAGVSLNGAGEIVFTLECTPGVPLNLQKSAALEAAWETVLTVTPDTSPATLSLPVATLDNTAFFQAVQE